MLQRGAGMECIDEAPQMDRRSFIALMGAMFGAAVLGTGTQEAEAVEGCGAGHVAHARKRTEELLERAIRRHRTKVRPLDKERVTRSTGRRITRRYSRKEGWWACAYGLNYCSVSRHSVLEPQMATQYRLMFDCSKRQAAKARRKAKQIARKARKKHPESKRRQLKYVHDWLARNVAYATAVNAPHDDITSHDLLSTPYGALCLKKAYCAGYANAFSLVAAYLGYTTRICVGNDHAWNEVKLSGRWRVVDCCFDDATVNHRDNEKALKRYLFKSRTAARRTDRRRRGYAVHVTESVAVVKRHPL